MQNLGQNGIFYKGDETWSTRTNVTWKTGRNIYVGMDFVELDVTQDGNRWPDDWTTQFQSWWAFLFGLGRSTVREIVVETCEVVTTKLLSRYVNIPQESRLREVVDRFEVRWGFPQVAGAIDGTHIPIVCPKDSPSDYYNRKGFVLLSCRLMWTFEDCSCIPTLGGHAGKVHDARVFSNSSICDKGREGTLFPDWNREINGVQVHTCKINIIVF